MISNNPETDINKILSNLSEDERNVALEIFRQYADTGQSELFEDIKYADFDEIPVDINTFMHDPNYLGKALIDAEGRFTVFPYWEEKLKEIFPDNLLTNYNTVIFTGSIGIGKSTIAVIIMLYLLYRMLCLKDPYLYYGLQPIDKISFSFMNINLENAKGVAMDKFHQMILASPWFLEHGEVAGTVNLEYRPNKHIECIAGSNNNHVIGRAIFCSMEDEVNFSGLKDVERAKKKELKLISQIDARMKSRYLRGNYLPCVHLIISSKDSDQSFLDSYIAMKKEQESKTTLVVDEPQWIVDTRKVSGKWFWVAIGNRFLANELVPLDATEEDLDKYRNKGYELLQVPLAYLEDFQTNIDGALADIAGRSISSTLKFISGDRFVQIKSKEYRNPFNKDIIEVGTAPTDYLQYANFFDLSAISEDDLAKPLFIHLDMSISGDKTGIAGVWITGRGQEVSQKALLPGNTINGLGQVVQNEAAIDTSGSLRYKLAFSVSVKAPKGYQISFEKTENFIKWLRSCGFNIKQITSDTFSAPQIHQDLQKEGFKTSILSVDRVDKTIKKCIPGEYLRAAIYERRLTIYDKCDLLTDEALGIERLSDGHLDHPKNGSKDQFDGLVGALFSASQYSDEYSYNYGDTVVASLEANTETSMNDKKTQFITNFQKELTNFYHDEKKRNNSNNEEELIDDFNIMDGILIF